MILVAYRHGLRASEVCDLQWQQIELSEGRLHVHRVKASTACSISAVLSTLTGLTSTRSDGASAWITANWLAPDPTSASRRTTARVTPVYDRDGAETAGAAA